MKRSPESPPSLPTSGHRPGIVSRAAGLPWKRQALLLGFAVSWALAANPIPPENYCPLTTCNNCEEDCSPGESEGEIEGGMGATATDQGSENNLGAPAGNCPGKDDKKEEEEPDEETPGGGGGDGGGGGNGGTPSDCGTAPVPLGTPQGKGGLNLTVNLGKSTPPACPGQESPSGTTPDAVTAGFSTGGSNFSDNTFSRSSGTLYGLNSTQYGLESGSGKLKWVRTGDAFVYLEDLGGGAMGYDMKFYDPADVGTSNVPDAGDPVLRAVRILKLADENSGTTKVGRMLEQRGAGGGLVREFRFRTITGGKSWELKEGKFTGTVASPTLSFLKKTLVATAPVSGDTSSYTETRTITDITGGGSTEVLKEEDTYKKITLTSGPVIRLVKSRNDPAGRNLTTERWYYTTGPAAGMVMRVHYPSGFWRHYQYMSDNARLFRTYSPFGSTAPPASTSTVPGTSGIRIAESDYQQSGWKRMDTIYLNGYVARREWLNRTGTPATGYTWTSVRAFNPGAAATSTENQTTTRVYYPKSSSAVSSECLKRVETHDGQVIQYTYERLAASGTLPARIRTTEEQGPKPATAPSGGLYTLTEGTRTVTENTESGRMVSTVETDIASGKKMEDLLVEDADDYGRPTIVLDQLLGRRKYTAYECCGVSHEQDFDGTLTHYLYDDFGRLKERQKGSRSDDSFTSGIQNWHSHHTWTRDALGRVTAEYRIPRSPAAGTPQLVSTTTYNKAGEITTVTDANGSSFLFRDDLVSGYRVEAKSWPLSGTPARYRTRVTKYHRDGSVYSESTYASTQTCHTASVPAIDSTGSGDIGNSVLGTYVYGYSHNGSYLVTRRNNAGKAGTGTAEYEITQTDILGRVYVRGIPSASNTLMWTYHTYFTAAEASGNRAAFGKLRKVDSPSGRTVLFDYDSRGRLYREVTDLNDNGANLSTDRVVQTAHSVVAAPGSPTMGARKTVTSIFLSGTTSLQIREELQSANGLYRKVNDRGRITETIREIPSNGTEEVTVILPDLTEERSSYSNGRLTFEESGWFDEAGVASPVLTGQTSYYYDNLGRMESQYQPQREAWTEYAWRTDDRVHSVTEYQDAAALVTEYGYDAAGNLISRELPNGTSVQGWTFNALGQVIESNGVEQYPVQYAYDDRGGRLRSLTTGVGSPTAGTTTWNYNSYGWLTGKRDANNQGVDYTYTTTGLLSSRQWVRTVSGGARLTASYAYHTYTGLLSSVSYNDGGATPGHSITYDRLLRQDIVTQGGNSWDYDYDAASLLADKETISYDTDANGVADFVRVLDRNNTDLLLRNKGWTLKTSGGIAEHTNTYGYSAADGRILTVSDGSDTFTYGYLSGTSLLQTMQGTTSGGSEILRTTNVWENSSPREVLSSKENKRGTTTVSKYAYATNGLGQRSGVTESGTAHGAGTSVNWTYNSRGELVLHNHSNASYDRAYEFDTIGNRKKGAAGTVLPGSDDTVSNTRNQYTSMAGFSMTWDADGNLSTDGGANAYATARSYTWDGENQLRRIQNTSGGTEIASYRYDPYGRRISKTTGGITLWFIHDSWNLIAEYQSGSLIRAHTWGFDLSGSLQGAGGVGGLLSTRIAGSGTYYPLYDGNGNIRQYLGAGSATPVAQYEYGPFGYHDSWSGTLAGTFNFRFSTKYMDPETTNYYYGFRYYSSWMGRWISRDPIEEDGGTNLYAMVGNDAVNTWDRLGLDPPEKGLNSGKCCGDPKKPYDEALYCCKDDNLLKREYVTDDAGRECVNCDMGIVELRVDDADVIGHVSLVLPNGRGYGHYPDGEASYIIPGPGKVNTGDQDHAYNPSQVTQYNACPETVAELQKSIDKNLTNEWVASNIGARNCAGWACDRLDDAGIEPPGYGANPFMRPHDVRSGGATGLRNGNK